jgi:hypothetical protein
VDDELKKKWAAEDKAFEEKLDKEAQQRAEAQEDNAEAFEKEVAEEFDLNITPDPNGKIRKANIEMSKQTMVEGARKSRETLKVWANRIDREGGTEPNKGRAN